MLGEPRDSGYYGAWFAGFRGWLGGSVKKLSKLTASGVQPQLSVLIIIMLTLSDHRPNACRPRPIRFYLTGCVKAFLIKTLFIL